MFTFVMVLNDECKIRITIHTVSTPEQLTMYFSWKWRTTTGTWMISLQFQIMSDDMTPRSRELLDSDKHRHELFSTLADCSQTIQFCKDLMKREYGDSRIAFVLLLTGFDEAEKLKNQLLAKYGRKLSSLDYKSGEPVYPSYADDTSESEKEMAKFSRETKNHLYYRKEMSSDDCKHRDFKENTTVYEKHVSMKKMLQVLLFIVFCAQANAKPLPNQTVPKPMSYELLSSPICSSANLDMSDTCQTDKYLLKLLINDHCGFTCGPTDEPTCVNTQEGGSAYVCLPENLTCEKGIRWVAGRDKNDPDRVIVWEETCTDGTYQHYPSNCFDACFSKHQKTDSIPEEYVLFSQGNNTSPALAYCNYLNGFYSVDNKTLLDYDEEVRNNWHTCQHFHDFCLEGKQMLSNGTCVEPCPLGICRDDHDMFICKLNCSSKERITEKTSFGDRRSDLTTTPREFATSSTDNNGKHIDQKNASSDSYLIAGVITALVSGIFILALIGVIILVVYFCGRKKGARATFVSKVFKQDCHKTTVTSKGNVYVNLHAPVKNKEKQTETHLAGNTEENNTVEPQMENLKFDQQDNEDERQNLQDG